MITNDWSIKLKTIIIDGANELFEIDPLMWIRPNIILCGDGAPNSSEWPSDLDTMRQEQNQH